MDKGIRRSPSGPVSVSNAGSKVRHTYIVFHIYLAVISNKAYLLLF